jgi:putative transposase
MLADLLSEINAAYFDESWENERTATPVRAFAVRLHETGCSLRETTTILAGLGVERSHGAVWNWVHRLADSGCDPPTAQPSRVAVDETAVKINGEWSWLYAAIDTETTLILDVALFGRYGTDRRLRSWLDSVRNTISQGLSFSSINSATGLPSLDSG